MLFILLRAALHERRQDDSCLESASDEDWRACHKLASAHGVMAVAWDGLCVQGSQARLPRDLRLNWGLAVQNYEAKYERYCAVASELSDLFAAHGISMIQMKGVGFSSYYPIPSHREGGDIDIYTSDGEEADKLIAGLGIEVDSSYDKHSCFYYKGIPVENHKTFLNVNSFALARPMDDLLKSIMAPECVELCGAKYRIKIPSQAFNSLFLSFHAAQHYGSGLALHHLFDWAVLLKTRGWCMPEEVTDRRFLAFVYGLNALCVKYLGVEPSSLTDEKMSEQILAYIFSPSFPFKAKQNRMNRFQILVYKTRRMIYRNKLQNSVFGTSLFAYVCNSIVSHLRSPQTIFKI